ncbi:conjugative transfer protein MobI(A/C) [Photobacterium leiognathi]|uniref:conjugative transfer protein MobI(A/C) n=1 Tax=Photobacterium leiognathi TaxID=553611 RepID=UPI0027338076|nr:conjugative transfer protein MobI(A/C) [Photobacterium leiognathi]
MEEIQQSIYKIIDLHYRDAVDVLTLWMRVISKRELNYERTKEKANYELRVEPHGVGFRIRWFHIKFTKNNHKLIRIAKSIPVPENGRYGKEKFKYAEPWELELIQQAEDEFSGIRYELKHLLKAHQSILYASKSNLGNEPLSGILLKDRTEITKPTFSEIKQSLSR